MRQKSYYSAAEITNNLYTTGSEWQTDTGAEYVGLYHKYSTGEVYTQPIWNPTLSKKLQPLIHGDVNNILYRTLKQDIKVKYDTPKTYLPSITLNDRKAGYITRYFMKKINDTNIIEVDSKQFEDYNKQKIDRNMYNVVQLKWYITGTITDVKQGNVVNQGVITKNSKEITEASKTIPGLSTKLNNLTQFYSDSDFVVPADINAR